MHKQIYSNNNPYNKFVKTAELDLEKLSPIFESVTGKDEDQLSRVKSLINEFVSRIEKSDKIEPVHMELEVEEVPGDTEECPCEESNELQLLETGNDLLEDTNELLKDKIEMPKIKTLDAPTVEELKSIFMKRLHGTDDECSEEQLQEDDELSNVPTEKESFKFIRKEQPGPAEDLDKEQMKSHSKDQVYSRGHIMTSEELKSWANKARSMKSSGNSRLLTKQDLNDLTGNKSIKELEEIAHARNREANKKKNSDDPCWDNYEMVGMKEKGNKKVPNCVPKDSASNNEDNNERKSSDILNSMLLKYAFRVAAIRLPAARDSYNHILYYLDSGDNLQKVSTNDVNAVQRALQAIGVSSLQEIQEPGSIRMFTSDSDIRNFLNNSGSGNYVAPSVGGPNYWRTPAQTGYSMKELRDQAGEVGLSGTEKLLALRYIYTGASNKWTVGALRNYVSGFQTPHFVNNFLAELKSHNLSETDVLDYEVYNSFANSWGISPSDNRWLGKGNLQRSLPTNKNAPITHPG